MRYIDADAFELNVQNEWKLNEISNGDWILFRQLLNEEPTVDAVEVVRCKDCKHRDAEDGFCKGRGWPMQLVPDDGFCDKGKRSMKP